MVDNDFLEFSRGSPVSEFQHTKTLHFSIPSYSFISYCLSPRSGTRKIVWFGPSPVYNHVCCGGGGESRCALCVPLLDSELKRTLSRAAMPKLVSLEKMTLSVYILLFTNIPCSESVTAIRWRLSHETHEQATNAIKSRDFERGRVLCSTQKAERGKSTHPSFAQVGHHWSRA